MSQVPAAEVPPAVVRAGRADHPVRRAAAEVRVQAAAAIPAAAVDRAAVQDRAVRRDRVCKKEEQGVGSLEQEYFTNEKGVKLACQRSEDSREPAPQDSPDTNEQGMFDESIGCVR